MNVTGQSVLCVASFMGAWIETAAGNPNTPVDVVASFMGAWIETNLRCPSICCTESHPLWVRGLKQKKTISYRDPTRVASFMGAWIETHSYEILRCYISSHPLWVRGLKPQRKVCDTGCCGSHPLWVRGLKLWPCSTPYNQHSRILYGCVD